MCIEPFYYICGRCGFKSDESRLWGRFMYESPTGLVEIARQTAWCESCSDFSPVEFLPDTGKIESLEKELSDKKSLIEEYRVRVRQGYSWLDRLLRKQPRLTPDLLKIDFKCSDLERQINDFKRIMPVIASRKSPPRCLRCSSTECFIPPKFPSADLEGDDFTRSFTIRDSSVSYERQGKPMNLMHPHCGGEMYSVSSGIYPYIRFKIRVYNSEGEFLRSESMNKDW